MIVSAIDHGGTKNKIGESVPGNIHQPMHLLISGRIPRDPLRG